MVAEEPQFLKGLRDMWMCHNASQQMCLECSSVSPPPHIVWGRHHGPAPQVWCAAGKHLHHVATLRGSWGYVEVWATNLEGLCRHRWGCCWPRSSYLDPAGQLFSTRHPRPSIHQEHTYHCLLPLSDLLFPSSLTHPWLHHTLHRLSWSQQLVLDILGYCFCYYCYYCW